MAMDARSLVALGPRVPEMLGNFHLDDHNVEEWSDATNPGIRHKARKEIGKWIDPENNADIQYQKREDCKQSDRSQEQTRTEVIKGQAPDSTFQIVRSHSQFQDVGSDNCNSRVKTSSTSYQMSSSSGVRSTSKSTSNRTTTKTVTVSGGRSDDFENLKMSFQPLDTSTQRERINVSRSGTMGIRRPPTRRHTPAAALSSSPEDIIDTRDEIIVDSDDNVRNTPDLTQTSKLSEAPGGLSIVGFKNICPKIRVGFPVEIQLELQTKLRSSSNMGRDVEEEIAEVENSSAVKPIVGGSGTYHHRPAATIMQDTRKEVEQMERIADDSANPLFELSANNEDSTFDFKQRRKSYGFESFDSHTKQSKRTSDHAVAATQCDLLSSDDTVNHVTYHRPIITNHKIGYDMKPFIDNSSENSTNRSSTTFPGLSPSSISRSWDLIQSAVTAQQRREANKKLFHSTSNTSSTNQSYSPTIDSNCSPIESYPKYKPSQTTTVTLNTFDEHVPKDDLSISLKDTMNSLKSLNSSRLYSSQKLSSVANVEETENIDCTPDVLDHETSVISPSLERSRKLLKMLDEAKPDLLHKMSYKNYFSDGVKSEEKHWEDLDWETQRQLSFLNDSLTRILEDGRMKESRSYDKTGHDTDSSNWINHDHSRMNEPAVVDDTEMDINGNVKSRIGQISQTWITSGEQKAKVVDKGVTTSISATNDPFKRGPKKVEFCKTEVHFTADSGKVHIVETDENKPSTSHLFRKKKKGDKGKLSTTTTEQEEQSDKSEGLGTSQTVEEERTIAESEGRELKCGVGVVGELLFQHRSEVNKTINRDVPPPTTTIPSKPNPLTMKDPTSFTRPEIISPNKSLPMLPLLREKVTDGLDDEGFERSHHIHMHVGDAGDEMMQSPSHMILSNYGEMKIQRYLKQLKSPSSNNGSDSPTEHLDLAPDHDHSNHFRFDNVLYDHGSFVPLATRRSLIEMNNRNRKRNTTLHVSDNASTTSNYSLPNSERDNLTSAYQPLRLAKMEAKVATARAKPQITSVELRYELENNERPSNPELMVNRQHHLNLRQKTDKNTFVSSNLRHNEISIPGGTRLSHSISPEESQSLITSQELHRNAKPPTPILPNNYSAYEKEVGVHDRYFYNNPNYEYSDRETEENVSRVHSNDFAMSASSVTSTAHNKGISKSIVTIGDYDVSRPYDNRRIPNSDNFAENSDTFTPEPVLSMDHTWKGPAHFDNETPSANKTTPVARSLTFPKVTRSEPEWVSKARSRETRLTDWDLIGKPAETGTVKTEPPWMDELMRYRSKSTNSEEIKALPKISIVYPWQRSAEDSKTLEEDKSPAIEEIEERSHIVSIVPTPPMLSARKESGRGSHYATAKSTTILPSPKLSEPSHQLQNTSKRDIVDRDSDSIVINSSQILKKAEQTETKSKNKLRFEGQGQLVDYTTTTSKSKGSSSKGVNENEKATVSKSRNTSKTSPKDHSTTKSDTATIKSSKNPKPPPRISSLVKAEVESTQMSGKSTKSVGTQVLSSRDKSLRRGIIKKSDVEESSGSSRSNTPIHRHPTVQVSKLPIRKNQQSKATESKPFSTAFGSRVKNKEKHHVDDNLESKQSGKSKMKPDSGNSPTTDPTLSTSLKIQKVGEKPDRRNITQKTVPKALTSTKKK